MAEYRDGKLIIRTDRGFAIKHRLYYSLNSPIEFNLPAVAKNFTAYAFPRLEIYEAKKKFLENLGLEEDKFGWIHTPSYSPFAFQQNDPTGEVRIVHGSEYYHIRPMSEAQGAGAMDNLPPVVPGLPIPSGEITLGNTFYGGYGNSSREIFLSFHMHPPRGANVTCQQLALGTNTGVDAVIRTHEAISSERFAAVTKIARPPRLVDTQGTAAEKFDEGESGAVADDGPVTSEHDPFRSYETSHKANSSSSADSDVDQHTDNESSHDQNHEDRQSESTGDGHDHTLEPAIVETGVAELNVDSDDEPTFEEIESYFESKGVPKMIADRTESKYNVSRMVQEEKAGIVRRQSHSHQYLGDPNSTSFKRVINSLPDDENAALFWRNLPANIEAGELITYIDTGAIFAVHIRPALDGFKHAAANVTFMSHAGAAALLEKIHSLSGLKIRSKRVGDSDVMYNKHGLREFTDYPRKSRVLHIYGPTRFMKWPFWLKFFREACKCSISHYKFLEPEEEGMTGLEVGFARFDAQAESIVFAIRKDKRLRGGFTVDYARDPCDPVTRRLQEQ